MPVLRKKRDKSSGKFLATQNNQEDETQELAHPQRIGHSSFNFFFKVVILIVLLICLAPWLFIFSKKSSVHQMTRIINDFFSDSFSCDQRNSNWEINSVNSNKSDIF
jgi:hypothetical protein